MPVKHLYRFATGTIQQKYIDMFFFFFFLIYLFGHLFFRSSPYWFLRNGTHSKCSKKLPMYLCIVLHLHTDSLWPDGAMWQHVKLITWSNLAQEMALCLTEPNHYLTWLEIMDFHASPISQKISNGKIYHLKLIFKDLCTWSTRGSELNFFPIGKCT